MGSSAETTQACPDMLEVVSAGVNKWTGMRSLMASLGVPQAATMAMGDGMNDYPIVSQAAIGIAMGNAHPEVVGSSLLLCFFGGIKHTHHTLHISCSYV